MNSEEKEKLANTGSNLVTLTGPSHPGQAMLQARVDGVVVYSELFTVESWNAFDAMMRDSLNRYRN